MKSNSSEVRAVKRYAYANKRQ